MKPDVPHRRHGRLRRLTDEEIALWTAVARTVAARPDAVLPQAARPTPAAVPPPPQPAPREATPAPAPPPATRAPVPSLVPLERRLRQKLARGRLAPDATIDLHGLRRHEASLALRAFLLRAQQDGAKLVLVVTGKGSAAQGSPRGAPGAGFDEEPGVLRRAVPHWLRGHDYHAVVVGFEEAARPHGGGGALYVRLRSLRRTRPVTGEF